MVRACGRAGAQVSLAGRAGRARARRAHHSAARKILLLLDNCLVNLGLGLPSSLSPGGNRKREAIEQLNRLGTQGQGTAATTANSLILFATTAQ